MPFAAWALVRLHLGAQPNGQPCCCCAGLGGILASSVIGSRNRAHGAPLFLSQGCLFQNATNHSLFVEPSCTMDASRRHPNVVSSLHFAQVLSGGGAGGQSAELAAAPGAISPQVNGLAPATPAAVLCPRGSQRAAANVYSR